MPCWGMAATASQRRRTSGARPFSSLPTTERDRTVAEPQVVERLVRLARQAYRPHAELAQLTQSGGHSAHDREGQVLDRPGRRLGHRGRQSRRAVARQHHAGHPGALGTAQQCAQIARVGDAGRHQQERCDAAAVGSGQIL